MRDDRALNSAWAWTVWFVQLALALTAFVIAIDALTNGPKQHEDRAGYCEPKQDGAILEPIGVDGADKNATGEQRAFPPMGFEPRTLALSKGTHNPMSGVRA